MTITADGTRSTAARPCLSRREHLITVACSAWLIGGLPDDVVAPSLRQFLPALVSTTVLTATVAFFFMHFSPFITEAMHAEPYRFAASLPRGGGWLADELLLEGLAAILLTTLILLGSTLMLLRRWRVPAGSLTVLFTVTAALESSLWGFEMGETIMAAGIAGMAADALAQRLQGTVSTPTMLRVVGFVVPVVLWLGYFAVLTVFYSVGWSVELWAGITVMSGLAGLGLAVLMTLPAPPSRVAPESDHVL